MTDYTETVPNLTENPAIQIQATMQADTVFYWRADQTPDEYSIFRVSGEAARDVRDVPAHEIAMPSTWCSTSRSVWPRRIFSGKCPKSSAMPG